MNLIFYPADFNLSYIKDQVRLTITNLESKNEQYKLFDYNSSIDLLLEKNKGKLLSMKYV
jgi:hypothetical protein